VSGTGATGLPGEAREVGVFGPGYFGSCSGGANTYSWRVFAVDEMILEPPFGSAVRQYLQIETFAEMHSLGEGQFCQQ
jgi:hypothetical protein